MINDKLDVIINHIFRQFILIFYTAIVLEELKFMQKPQIVKIIFLLRSIGMPSHILGYTYTAEAIDYMLAMPNKSLFINDIYHHIALCYSTSSSCVEVSIRNAIKKTHNSNNIHFNKIFENTSRIGNHIFLTVLRDIVEANYMQYP